MGTINIYSPYSSIVYIKPVFLDLSGGRRIVLSGYSNEDNETVAGPELSDGSIVILSDYSPQSYFKIESPDNSSGERIVFSLYAESQNVSYSGDLSDGEKTVLSEYTLEEWLEAMGDNSDGVKSIASEYSNIVSVRVVGDDLSDGEMLALSDYTEESYIDAEASLFVSDGEIVIVSGYTLEEYILASLSEYSLGNNNIFSDYSNEANVTTPQVENIPFSKKYDKCGVLLELPDYSIATGGRSSNHSGSRKQYTKTLP